MSGRDDGESQGEGLKRSVSGTRSDWASSSPSRGSRGTAAHYRFGPLRNASIRIHFQPAADLRAQIVEVIQTPISTERKETLTAIVHRLNHRFIQIVGQGVGEDECIGALHTALTTMEHAHNFSLLMNSSVAIPSSLSFSTLTLLSGWAVDLKPSNQQSGLDSDFDLSLLMAKTKNNEIEDQADRPSKRQQGSAAYISPVTSTGSGGISLEDAVSVWEYSWHT